MNHHKYLPQDPVCIYTFDGTDPKADSSGNGFDLQSLPRSGIVAGKGVYKCAYGMTSTNYTWYCYDVGFPFDAAKNYCLSFIYYPAIAVYPSLSIIDSNGVSMDFRAGSTMAKVKIAIYNSTTKIIESAEMSVSIAGNTWIYIEWTSDGLNYYMTMYRTGIKKSDPYYNDFHSSVSIQTPVFTGSTATPGIRCSQVRRYAYWDEVMLFGGHWSMQQRQKYYKTLCGLYLPTFSVL